MKLDDVDLSDSSVFEKAVPHDYFAFLRKEAPVSWTGRNDGTGFWSVTRYKDIVELETNVEAFSSETSVTPLEVPPEVLAATVGKMIILTDPPRHTQLRKLIMSGFTPKAISVIEERIRELAVASIDAVIEDGRCDWHDVAAHMPIEVVADLLGVPAQDRQHLFNWANAMFGGEDPRVSSLGGMHKAQQEMFAYALKLASERRAQPGEDVFSQVAIAKEDGEMLSDFDLGCFFLILATAGNETTRTQILHGTLALIENPEAMQALRDDPSLINNAIEEMLRYTTPALGFGRLATRDYQIAGQTIKAGDRVLLWYCSGNRDEAVFTDPNRFDVRRSNARDHLAFGAKAGIHRCLGAMLARAELKAMFQQITTRLPDIRLDGEVLRLRSNFTNGIHHMPVVFTPGKPTLSGQKLELYASNVATDYASA